MIIIGDTHGIRPVFEIIDKHNLTSQNLIHVGDLGLGFLPIEKELENLNFLDIALRYTNNHLYAIRGNHDNPIFWDKSFGLNLPKYSNLHLVEDYSVINIEDKNILFIGGAISIDRSSRAQDKPYSSWWIYEEMSIDRQKLRKLSESKIIIDTVITHNCPHFCYPQFKMTNLVKKWVKLEKENPIMDYYDLKEELKEERESFTKLHDILIKHFPIKKWFYGHFHQSHTENIGGIQFTMLGINEVKELK